MNDNQRDAMMDDIIEEIWDLLVERVSDDYDIITNLDVVQVMSELVARSVHLLEPQNAFASIALISAQAVTHTIDWAGPESEYQIDWEIVKRERTQ